MSDKEAEFGDGHEEGTIEHVGTVTEALARPGAKFDPWLRGVPGLLDFLWFLATEPKGEGYVRRVPAFDFWNGPPRQRAMKQRDIEALRRTLDAVHTSLALAILTPGIPNSIAVSLRTARQGSSRYERSGFTNLPGVLEGYSMAADFGLGPWKLYKSRQRGVPSIVVASEALEHFVWDYVGGGKRGPSARADFYRELGGETIILSRNTPNYIEGRPDREPIDYPDNPVADRYRAEMRRINEHLAAANMDFVPDKGPPVALMQRELRRYFLLLKDDPDEPARFDRGGRLFGAWWLNLPKARRGNIRLQGEPIADLDFSNMFLRLAYLHAGHEPPAGDLYANVPGLEEPFWREGVKGLVNALLSRSTPMQRLPRDPDLRKALPPGASGAALRQAILAAHPLLAGTFETGVAVHLQFLESQILVAAVLKMIDAGVVALPMHDGVMVPRSAHEVAAQCMAAASREVVGHHLPITLKAAY